VFDPYTRAAPPRSSPGRRRCGLRETRAERTGHRQQQDCDPERLPREDSTERGTGIETCDATIGRREDANQLAMDEEQRSA
jgi:hypothetical protein